MKSYTVLLQERVSPNYSVQTDIKTFTGWSAWFKAAWLEYQSNSMLLGDMLLKNGVNAMKTHFSSDSVYLTRNDKTGKIIP